MAVSVEHKPGAHLDPAIRVNNRVHQAAGTTHHRDGAIPHGDELPHAAGLESRGHEEDVAAGIDLPSEGHIKPAVHAEAPGIKAGGLSQPGVVRLVAGAYYY